MLIKKSDVVRSHLARGDYKKALLIAKDFRLGICQKESEEMKLAYDCIVHESFYRQLGIDTRQTIQQGVDVLERLYGREEANAQSVH